MTKQELREQIPELLGAYFEHAYMAGSMDEQIKLDAAAMNSRKCFELKQQIMTLFDQALIEARINTYQKIVLWLENQEDNDQLALLGKDISVELDSLFAQLTKPERSDV